MLAVKQTKIAPGDVTLPFLPPDSGTRRSVYPTVLHATDGNEAMHVSASLATGRHSERKEEIGSGERGPVFVFLSSLDCVGETFSWMTCGILHIGADEEVNDVEIE